MRRVRDKTGLPGLAVVLGLALWVVVLLLWATGAVKGGFAIFLGTVLSAAVGTGYLAAAAAKAKQPLRGARTVLLLVLIAVVPVVFDPHTGDVFNIPKYTVVVIGALALAGLWAVASVHDKAVPTWRNGFQWVVAALVAWTAVSALTGLDVHVGLLGNYGSYDGLFSAACFGVMAMTAAEALDGEGVRRALGHVRLLRWSGGRCLRAPTAPRRRGERRQMGFHHLAAGLLRPALLFHLRQPQPPGRATWPCSFPPSWYWAWGPSTGRGERCPGCWRWPFSPS